MNVISGTLNSILYNRDILNPDNSETYIVDNKNNYRPLSRFLICSNCGNKLTGYVVKKKEVHYYKCNVCKGVNLNANTTKRSLKPGLNNSFQELLNDVEMEEKYIRPFKLQLKKMFKYLHSETQEVLQKQKKLKVELEGKLAKLEEKYLYDDLDKEVYTKHKHKLESELFHNSRNISEQENKLSNHSDFIDKAINVITNISKYWGSGDIATKERIQKVVFPDGLVIDPVNRTYLTNNINTIFHLTKCISEGKDVDIKKLPTKNDEESYQVAGTGLEPATFGL